MDHGTQTAAARAMALVDYRECASCGRSLSSGEFSRNQKQKPSPYVATTRQNGRLTEECSPVVLVYSKCKTCARQPNKGQPTGSNGINAELEQRTCIECNQSLPLKSFSHHQQLKPNSFVFAFIQWASPEYEPNQCTSLGGYSKCKACVDKVKVEGDAQPRLKRCVQCFRSLPKTSFSKRQAQLLDPKCKTCVEDLERAAAASSAHVASKWKFDQYYRVCHRDKSGGVSVRVKHNIASPLLGYIPLGRVFRATAPICNEQGDPMVRLEGPHLPTAVMRFETKYSSKEEDGRVERQIKEAWVPCRSIRNEILLEPHQGPYTCNGDYERPSRFFRCVVEGCKVRGSADLAISELGYVLYGDVVEVVESIVAPDGLVFLRLHERYFDGAAWVVERSLDNESVLNEVEGPWTSSPPIPRTEAYRCVQDSGAPVRMEPELSAAPVGRIPCGAVVTVVERAITDQRQVFLRIVDFNAIKNDEDTHGDKWVIETSSCCASVMIKVNQGWQGRLL
ncbi:hypothetical protein AM587_10010860 [Phytophthora nicotianae]|uniref:Stc1 domain-containing protein n=1 Tax=Phytophthora nicotianae TaxID=4792 RepID=A0A0W8C5J9_PHYNI|nr:hypothetical protein AM587_10010860 [Phytophthora nicotianae]